MKRLFIVMLSLFAVRSVAEEVIDASAAADLLRGNTFAGTNASGQDFWFYQGPSGGFEAKFKKSYGSESYYDGTWYAKGANKICWDWRGGDVHC